MTPDDYRYMVKVAPIAAGVLVAFIVALAWLFTA